MEELIAELVSGKSGGGKLSVQSLDDPVCGKVTFDGQVLASC